MYNRSKKHLDDVHETYAEHMGFAMQIAWLMLSGFVMVVLHALIPGIFCKSGSNRINMMTKKIRSRQAEMSQSQTDFNI